MPWSQAAWTRPVFAGSYSWGLTSKKPGGSVGLVTGAASALKSVNPNFPGSSFGPSPAEAPERLSVAAATTARAITTKSLLLIDVSLLTRVYADNVSECRRRLLARSYPRPCAHPL
jgi:hypothetical protein